MAARRATFHPGCLFISPPPSVAEERMRMRNMSSASWMTHDHHNTSRRRCFDGGRFKGYGWPATLRLLAPFDTATSDSRQIKMILCPSCNTVHEFGGKCLFSRHRRFNPPPATAIPKSDPGFTAWLKNGMKYEQLPNGSAKFHGEAGWMTNPKVYDCDGDGASDGQEVYGYTVTVTWYEGSELKSKDVQVKGHPWGKYMRDDNVTPLDVDEDGISDIDEMDPVNSTARDPTKLPVFQFWLYYTSPEHRNDSMLKDQFNPFVRETIPPLLVEAYAKGHETWGWCWIVPCVTRSWTTAVVKSCARNKCKESLTIHHGADSDGDIEGAGDATRLSAEEAWTPQGEQDRVHRV